ncbi:hypothetical protein, partial [Pseudomonas putida]
APKGPAGSRLGNASSRAVANGAKIKIKSQSQSHGNGNGNGNGNNMDRLRTQMPDTGRVGADFSRDTDDTVSRQLCGVSGLISNGGADREAIDGHSLLTVQSSTLGSNPR